jgi:hypothetical protein
MLYPPYYNMITSYELLLMPGNFYRLLSQSNATRNRVQAGAKGRWEEKMARKPGTPQNHDDSLSTQPAVVSQTTFDERIRAIPSMDLEALPSVIDEARLVENVAAQSTVVEACL